jgi:hypothetical protein
MSITMRFGSAAANAVAGGIGAMGATGTGDATGGLVEAVALPVAGGTVVVVVEAPAAGGGGVGTEPSDERFG